ncbi:MAG: hypothetical protein ACSLE1_13050 [Sphingobium sp.]
MTAQPIDQSILLLDEHLPPITYRDLSVALKMVAVGERHREMIPYFVSALHQQAPFLTSQLVAFEIVRSGNCLADVMQPPVLDG